jgi:hypothetical protein
MYFDIILSSVLFVWLRNFSEQKLMLFFFSREEFAVDEVRQG